MSRAAAGVALVAALAAAPSLFGWPTPRAGAAPAVARDTTIQLWASSVSASAGELVDVGVRADLTGSGMALGLARGRIRFQPSLLQWQGFRPGDGRSELRMDTDRAGEGVVTFELEGESPGGISGRATLATLTFRVTGPAGGRAPVILEADALEAAADGTDLLGRTLVRDGSVIIH